MSSYSGLLHRLLRRFIPPESLYPHSGDGATGGRYGASVYSGGVVERPCLRYNGFSHILRINRLFRFQVQTAFPEDGTAAGAYFAEDGTAACAYYIEAACTQKRNSR